MLIAAIICLLLALMFWAQVYYCEKKSKVHDGNLEWLGVILYWPLAVLTSILTALFGFLALVFWFLGLT
jgi:hypothetical protein